MTTERPGQGDGRDRAEDERFLRELLSDAVSDVEPRDGLTEVRRRTRARRTPARRWTPVLAGAGAVAATVVAAGLVVASLGEEDHDAPVAGSSTSDSATTSAAGIYFVSDTATGPRLFREFQVIGATTDASARVLSALQRLGEDFGPRDPDYRTLWPAGSFRSAQVEDDRIVVELGSDAALEPAGELSTYGVQQAVYTAEAAIGQALPVAFERDGAPVHRVLGLRVGTVVDRLRSGQLTAPVNITDPAERLAVEGDTFSANGTMAADAQSAVHWSLERGGRVVLQGRATPIDITGPDARATLGAPGWETDDIDVSDLPSGDYVFKVTVTDVGQTSDRPEEFSDTRSITIR